MASASFDKTFFDGFLNELHQVTDGDANQRGYHCLHNDINRGVLDISFLRRFKEDPVNGLNIPHATLEDFEKWVSETWGDEPSTETWRDVFRAVENKVGKIEIRRDASKENGSTFFIFGKNLVILIFRHFDRKDVILTHSTGNSTFR